MRFQILITYAKYNCFFRNTEQRKSNIAYFTLYFHIEEYFFLYRRLNIAL